MTKNPVRSVKPNNRTRDQPRDLYPIAGDYLKIWDSTKEYIATLYRKALIDFINHYETNAPQIQQWPLNIET
ncbi:MAG: hypothetical protein GY940_12355 [bacterium]|nr:hypothetical protein [bacterium]